MLQTGKNLGDEDLSKAAGGELHVDNTVTIHYDNPGELEKIKDAVRNINAQIPKKGPERLKYLKDNGSPLLKTYNDIDNFMNETGFVPKK